MSERRRRAPEPSRPNIPYGLLGPGEGMGLLPWRRVSEKMQSAHIYWVATTCPDGRPHATPVWGVWLDETFYFSNGRDTRTGHNLAANPAIAVHLESGEDAVILEGVAQEVTEPSLIARVNGIYRPKYQWDEPVRPLYALRPRVAFAWLCRGGGPASANDYTGSATRWPFQNE